MSNLSVVCACIIQEDRVLIAKRKSKVDCGIWEFPGGKVEANESNEQAIIREIQEELNVQIKILQPLITILDKTKSISFPVHAFACEIMAGELSLREHSEMKWVACDQIDLNSFHASDGPIIQACRDYIECVKISKTCESM